MFKKHTGKRNTFRMYFFCATTICCVALSVVFFYIGNLKDKVIWEQYNQEKLQLVMKDWEEQLDIMEEVAVQIATNYRFHPYYFQGNVAREWDLLDTLAQYRHYTALTEDFFVYYGRQWIYRSSGKTLTLERFAETKSKDEAEKQQFLDTLTKMQTEKDTVSKGPYVCVIFDEIYAIIPMRVSNGEQYIRAILAFSIEKSALEKRFQVVSGGIRGKLWLCRDENILFSDASWDPDEKNSKDMISIGSINDIYSIKYLPSKERNLGNGMLFLQILLVFADVFLVFIIANIFANKAYLPIQILADQYKEKDGDRESDRQERRKNAIEELHDRLDHLVQNNNDSHRRILESNRILKKQILHLIIEGKISQEVLNYLEKLEISLPGPYYWVVSIAIEAEDDLEEEASLQVFENALEKIPDRSKKEFVYLVRDYDNRQMNVICSAATAAGQNRLTEMICEAAESYENKMIIGVGNTYQSLDCISASWLESMDIIQNEKNKLENEKNQRYVYDFEKLIRISEALENGSREAALERLKVYIDDLKKSPMSFLMQQYIIAGFLGEIRRLCDKYQIGISKQNISLLLSSRDVSGFEKASFRIVEEFCDGFEQMLNEMQENDAKKIYTYIHDHFAEYDISLERVAEQLHTNTEAVRLAVMKYTGKMYKDYIILLRIEYAKELLSQGNLSVEEICQQVGYGNVSYFIKLFRKMTGVTPAKYKKNIVFK